MALLYWQVLHEESPAPSSATTTTSSARRTGKVKLAEFTTPRSRKIAKNGHKAMRCYIATKMVFPLPVNKDTVCWDSIVAGLKGDKSLTAKLESEDEETKAMLLDYVSNI